MQSNLLFFYTIPFQVNILQLSILQQRVGGHTPQLLQAKAEIRGPEDHQAVQVDTGLMLVDRQVVLKAK